MLQNNATKIDSFFRRSIADFLDVVKSEEYDYRRTVFCFDDR